MIVALCCVPAFLGAFDFGFMVLAGPRLGADVGAGAAYAWLFSAASFAFGAAVMPATGLRARPLTLGLALAAAGSALVASAWALPAALAGRVLFGLGGGIAAPAALARLATLERPARGFSWLGASVALGFTTGTLVATTIPWRHALAAVTIVTAAAAITATRHASAHAGEPRLVPGALLFSAATVALAVALAGATWVLVPAFVLAVAAGRRAAPRLPPRRAAAGAVLLAAAATTASGVGATVVLGRAGSGLVLAAFGVAALPAARLAGVLAPRRGAAVAGGAGLALQALALIGAGVVAGPAPMAVAIAAFGAGHVIANAGAAGAAAALAGEHVAPVAGLLVTAQYAGAGAGSLLMTGVADRRGTEAAVLVAAAIAAAGALALLSGARRASARAAPRTR